MEDNFHNSFAVIRRWEGGWSDHKDDPGGKTKWGITLRLLKSLGKDFNGDGVIDGRDLKEMTHGAAEAIYHVRFWQACRCDRLPRGLDLAVFDCAVNQGTGRAARLLQKALGVKVDGILGPKTLEAAGKADLNDLLLDFMAWRILHYSSLSIFVTFGRGWMRRVLDVHATARTMSS
jgi:lysozyme family protein